MVLQLQKPILDFPDAGDVVCLREDKHTAKIRANMVRAHSQQKPSPNTMSWMRTEGLKPESERDSGFSDASSEHLSALDQMDSDETARDAYPGAQASPLVMGAPYSGMSPMIFMNNSILTQPNETPASPEPWSFRPAVEVLPQPQVLFLQPVVSTKPSQERSVSMKCRRSKKYLPILKSYPKIAPHPGDSCSSTAQSSCSSTAQSSSSSTAQSSCSSTAQSSSSSHCHRHKRQSRPAGIVLLPPPALPVSASPRSLSPKHSASPRSLSPKHSASLRSLSPRQCPPQPEVHTDSSRSRAGLELPGPPSDDTQRTPSPSLGKRSSPHAEAGALAPCPWSAERADAPPGEDCDSKRKRFCNTYNILSQSGLLDITLRMQELVRQNQHSQGQLERLQAHAGLFLQAVRSGSPDLWTTLQTSMLQAGSEAMEEDN